MKYRLAKVSTECKVTSSIKIISFTSPSVGNLNSYILGLEIENVSGNRNYPINLRQMSSMSAVWRLEPLSYDENSSGGGGLDQSMFSIAPRESTNIFFRITPGLDQITKISNTETLDTLYTNLAFQHKMVMDSTESPYGDFLVREKISSLRQFSKYHNTVRYITDPYNLDVLLLWELGDNIVGQQNILNLNFLPSENINEIANDNTPLRFLINAPSKVTHDFKAENFCVVPIQLHVKNASPQSPISYDFEALKLNSVVDKDPAAGQIRSQFFWYGVTKYRVNQLQPGCETSLSLKVCFSKPGVYNINKFKFIISVAGGTAKDIYSPCQHLITVEDPKH